MLDPAQVAEFDPDEEHIVSKTARFVDQLLNLGDHLAELSAVGRPESSGSDQNRWGSPGRNYAPITG